MLGSRPFHRIGRNENHWLELTILYNFKSHEPVQINFITLALFLFADLLNTL